MTGWSRATVAGFACVGRDAGFAVPLFRPEYGDVLLLQDIDEWTGRVAGFFLTDAEPSGRIDADVSTSIGNSQVFVFVEPSGNVLCGSLEQIGCDLKEISRGCSPEISLQIAELVGTANEKLNARSAVHRLLSDQQGESAARLHRNSALRAELWQLLLAGAPNHESAQEILALRSRLVAWVRANGAVDIDVSALDAKKFSWIDVEELRRELASGFANLASSAESYFGPNDVDDFAQLSIQNVLEHVHLTTRQEQRIAILLSVMAADELMAQKVLSLYEPRTQFELRAFEVLKRYLAVDSRPHKLPWMSLVELSVVKIYNQLFPRHRGRFLLFLAHYLGGYSSIAEFIRERTVASKSYDIVPYADDVFIELERHHWTQGGGSVS